MSSEHSALTVWSPPIDGIREVFHAENFDHSYPSHVHDTWTVFVVDDGAIHYRLDRHDRFAVTSMVSVLPPGVPHDGRPSGPTGFNKRVLYIESSVLPERLIGRAVDAPAIDDPILRSAVGTLHRLLHREDDDLHCETLMTLVTTRIKAWLEQRDPLVKPGSTQLARAYREILDEHLFDRFRLVDAAEALQANPTHLARSFTEAFGISPHRYKTSRRIDAARQRLLTGHRPADVAHDLGFTDQAHLTRVFRTHVGTTPGQLASSRSQVCATPG